MDNFFLPILTVFVNAAVYKSMKIFLLYLCPVRNTPDATVIMVWIKLRVMRHVESFNRDYYL